MDAQAAEAIVASATDSTPSPFGQVVYWIELLNGWGTVGLLVIVALTAWIFWRLNKGGTAFRLGDALIDPMTSKASILRVAFFVCLIASWATVFYCLLAGKEFPASVLGLLAIFVTPLITTRAFEIWDPRTKAAAFNASPAAAAVETAKALQPPTPPTTRDPTTLTATATTEGVTQ